MGHIGDIWGDIRGDIRAWVARTACDLGLAPGAQPPELVNTWRTSETATVYRFRLGGPDQQQVVVKRLHTPAQARALFHSMAEAATALAAAAPGQNMAPRPLGLSEDLGLVMMPYIRGRVLGDVLRASGWSAGGTACDLVRRCGGLLAAYHGALADHGSDSQRAAWDDLEPRIALVVGCGDGWQHLADRAMVSRAYLDFQPQNVIVTDCNRLALIDPPVVASYRYGYTDLGLFTYKLFMLLLHPVTLAKRPGQGRCHQLLVDAFLDGYAAGRGHPLSEDDRFFITGCQAFLMTRRLASFRRRRSYLNYAYYLLPLRRKFQQDRAAMLQHLRRVVG